MLDKLTFINHATVLISLNGINIITDPVYSFSVSYFLPRLQRPGIPLERLPPLSAILISHNHYDHLNLRTLRRLRRRHSAAFIAPRGVGRYGRRTGFPRVLELERWESVEVEGVRITFVPAKHFSGRIPWDRNKSQFGGFIVEAGQTCVYFAGDTAHDEFFKELKNRFKIDVALLPIGAYKPHAWFRNIHLNPQTALQAFEDCGARYLIPIHWGTFKISDEPMDEPPQWLREEAKKKGILDRVHILRNGEVFTIDNEQ